MRYEKGLATLFCKHNLYSLFARFLGLYDNQVGSHSLPAEPVGARNLYIRFFLDCSPLSRPAAVYIADTDHHYYSVLTDEDQKLRNTLQPGDALEMLVTPRRAIGNPEVAYLSVNGHVYCTYEEYHSIAATVRIEYLVFLRF